MACGQKATPVQGHDSVRRFSRLSLWRLDIGRNAGFVNVGTDHDTGAFAVASIRGWWRTEGRGIYPEENDLIQPTGVAVTGGDCGCGSWSCKFADQTALGIAVCHFPPGTSKWTVEPAVSFISSNGAASVAGYETIVIIAGRREGIK